jgi:hypothetical protein
MIVSALVLDVEQERGRHLVPVPRVVRLVLVVTDDLAAIHVDGDHRGRVQVVAGRVSPVHGSAVARPPVADVLLWVVHAGDPDRCAAPLPRVAGPRLVAGLAGAGDRERLPHRVAGLGVERLDEAADAAFAARHAHHHRPSTTSGASVM